MTDQQLRAIVLAALDLAETDIQLAMLKALPRELRQSHHIDKAIAAGIRRTKRSVAKLKLRGDFAQEVAALAAKILTAPPPAKRATKKTAGNRTTTKGKRK